MIQQNSTHPDLSIEVGDDHVAIVEFDRPPSNFFDLSLLTSLAEECEQLADTTDTRAIVLCSAGKTFCAGADFSAPGENRDPGPVYEQALRLFNQPLPMVAAIQGASIGGGLGLALVADFRIAAPAASFAANFAQIGIHHGFGLSVTLPSAVGQKVAMDLLYTGRRIKAQEAQSCGLVDNVITPGSDLRHGARAFAAQIATSAPLAVRAIRTTLRDDLSKKFAIATAHERVEQQKLFLTADFQEGVAAVGERRSGEFIGR